MLRNLLLTIIMSLFLCTTAYTREPDYKLMSNMTKRDWKYVFECAGYMMGWLDHHKQAEEYKPQFVKFLEALGTQIDGAVAKGHMSVEMKEYILENVESRLDRGWNKFKRGKYNTEDTFVHYN